MFLLLALAGCLAALDSSVDSTSEVVAPSIIRASVRFVDRQSLARNVVTNVKSS